MKKIIAVIVLLFLITGCKNNIIQQTDEEILNETLKEIKISDTIKEDILLPTKIDDKEITITWASSNPKYISPYGKVNRPFQNEGDKEVILTATFHYKDITTTKDYPVTIQESDAILCSAVNHLDTIDFDTIKYENSILGLYDPLMHQEIDHLINNNSQNSTFCSPTIYHNPYKTNLLSDVFVFQNEYFNRLTYEVRTVNTNTFMRQYSQDELKSLANNNLIKVPIVGLIQDAMNVITVKLYKDDELTKEITYQHYQEKIGDGFPMKLNVVEQNNQQDLSDGLFVVIARKFKDKTVFFADNEGNIRSALLVSNFPNNFIKYDNQYVFEYSDGQIIYMDKLFRTQKVIAMPGYRMHHDFTITDDGKLVVLVTNVLDEGYQDDYVIIIDPTTNEIIKSIDMKDIFYDYNHLLNGGNWIHLNSVEFVNEESGELILSSRELSTIIVLKDIYQEPYVDYMIGPDRIWKDSVHQNLLINKGSNFLPNLGQHMVKYIPTDETGVYYLTMFNNFTSFNSKFSPEEKVDWSDIEGIDTTSKYYEYKVNATNKTYQLVNSIDVAFSKVKGSAIIYKDHMIVGSAWHLDDENKRDARIYEFDEDNNKLVEFKFDIEYGIYRAFKIDM